MPKRTIRDLTHRDLEAIREEVCGDSGCKGYRGFWDSDCRFCCDGFAVAAKDMKETA